MSSTEAYQDMNFGDLTSVEIGRLAPRMVAVLPLAAIEQHGNHLPVATDTAIVTELARRVEKHLASEIVLIPTLWVGNSHHHLAFPGTLSISSDTYVKVLEDLLESLLKSGFRRIFLLNGHGGNQTPFAEAIYRISLKYHTPWIAAQSYWKLAVDELDKQDFMDSAALSHACEYETSMMLALTAEINMEAATGFRPERKSTFYDPSGNRISRVVVSEPFDQLTPTGALGSPEKATKDKGQRLLALFTEVIVQFLREFQQWPDKDHETTSLV